jgi:hypothetical protein
MAAIVNHRIIGTRPFHPDSADWFAVPSPPTARR